MKFCFTADAYVVHKNKVLLRMHDKVNIWLPLGGHIEEGEDPEQAVIREVKEESGLKIFLGDIKLPKFGKNKLLPVPDLVYRHHVSVINHEHVSFTYFVKAKTLKIKPGAEEKPVEIKWFSKSDLKNKKFKIIPSVKYLALKALEKLTDPNAIS